MGIPKKGSRPIEVAGHSLRWRVRSKATREQRSGGVWQLAVSGERSTMLAPLLRPHPASRVASEAITPGLVAKIIQAALNNGWEPTVSGTFFLEGFVRSALESHPIQPISASAHLSPDQVDQRVRRKHRDHFELRLGEPYINGRSLISTLRTLEMPYAEKEALARAEPDFDLRAEDIAGRYMPLGLYLPSRNLLDEPDPIGFVLRPNDPNLGKATILGCDCGIVECGFVLVSIDLAKTAVVWSDFVKFHRPDWRLDLGPFVFDRVAYEAALGETTRQSAWQWWQTNERWSPLCFERLYQAILAGSLPNTARMRHAPNRNRLEFWREGTGKIATLFAANDGPPWSWTLVNGAHRHTDSFDELCSWLEQLFEQPERAEP